MTYRTVGTSPVEWAGRTAAEIGAIADRDGAVAVVPMGSIEQHGPHLPVATDTILVDAVAIAGAERAAEADVPVLVTPTAWLGSSPHHMALGGTLTGDVQTLQDGLGDVIEATIDHGFDRVLVVNGHGGNKALVAGIPRILGPEHPTVDVRACTYFELPEPEDVAAVRESDPGGMGHAGEFETALLLHLRPELVDMDAAEPAPSGGDMFGPSSPVAGYGEMGGTGVAGEPQLATAAAGAQFFEIATAALADVIEAMGR